MPSTASITTLSREPLSLSAGDNLLFERRLPDYPASQGWALQYQMRGGSQAISFQSTADGDAHLIDVPAATTATWIPGDYLLVGKAVNAAGNATVNIDAGETHQIYYCDFPVTNSLVGTPANANVTTHYQRMVTALQAVMEGKSMHDLGITKIEATVIERIPPLQYADFYARYYQLRQNEIDTQRAQSGQKSRTRVRLVNRVIARGYFYGQSPANPDGVYSQ